MPKSCACEEKQSNCNKEQTSNNFKLVRSSKIMVQLEIEHDVWQPRFGQPLKADP